MRLQQPWPEPYTVNRRSPWGWRARHPLTGERTFHHGIDVACPVGTPLTAGADGVVVHKGTHPSSGFNLIIRHEGNWHTVYYHLQAPSPLPTGQQVTTGQVVAYSGNTGASTGPHLHYELRRSQTWGDTVDPVPFIVKPQPKPEPVVVEPKPEPEPEPKPEPELTTQIDQRPPWGLAGPSTQQFTPSDYALRKRLGALPGQSVINGKLVGGSGSPAGGLAGMRALQQRAQNMLRPR